MCRALSPVDIAPFADYKFDMPAEIGWFGRADDARRGAERVVFVSVRDEVVAVAAPRAGRRMNRRAEQGTARSAP